MSVLNALKILVWQSDSPLVRAIEDIAWQSQSSDQILSGFGFTCPSCWSGWSSAQTKSQGNSKGDTTSISQWSSNQSTTIPTYSNEYTVAESQIRIVTGLSPIWGPFYRAKNFGNFGNFPAFSDCVERPWVDWNLHEFQHDSTQERIQHHEYERQYQG